MQEPEKTKDEHEYIRGHHPEFHVEDADGVQEAKRLAEESESGARKVTRGWTKWLVPAIALGWSVYQLYAATVVINSNLVRIVHLAFALALTFLCYPMFKKPRKSKVLEYFNKRDRYTVLDIAVALFAAAVPLYQLIFYEAMATRHGVYTPLDIFFGIALIIILLEAARRAVGIALPIVALVFIAYTFTRHMDFMPMILAAGPVSLHAFAGQVALTTEGIFGTPLEVSANIIFLFVLFGAMLDKAGAGRYFVDLAFSLLGGFRGGAAKAAVLASGLTGLVSGSSIANTVTTGTFTIPMMKKVGYPAYKAGAVEVACSTNGQLMPPIMGAAAFIIAEYCNMPYFDVVKAAFIPAVASYIALMYITHLEAVKLGLKAVDKSMRPPLLRTFLEGVHYLIPILVLIYFLAVVRYTPKTSVLYAIITLTIVMFGQEIFKALWFKEGLWKGVKSSVKLLISSLVAGGKNMITVGIAVSAAGIILGAVTLGFGNKITALVEIISGGNFIAILIVTAIASLILGMGLPTTATYIVMASLTAPVIITLGEKVGMEIPLIASHLFVFFFGILADDTPPVGLSAYAAAAIAKSDPIKTGIQGFSYDARTAILPFMFILNPSLLLIGVDSFWRAAWIFLACIVALFAFGGLTVGYLSVKNRWYEAILLAGIALALLLPNITTEALGLTISPDVIKTAAMLLFIGIYALQIMRKNKGKANAVVES